MELQIHVVRLHSWPQEGLRECYNMRPDFDQSDRLKMVQCRDLLMKCHSLDVLQSGQDGFKIISAGIPRKEVLLLAPGLDHVENLSRQCA